MAGKLEQPAPDRMERLIASRDMFLGFLSARLHDKAAAEDVLQVAYIKDLEHGSDIRDDESTVAWFYRILRNALIDHYRRTTVRDKGEAEYAAETPLTYEPELQQTACACIGDVIRDLKGEYRAAIEGVDLGGQSVEDFAKANHITSNNASVDCRCCNEFQFSIADWKFSPASQREAVRSPDEEPVTALTSLVATRCWPQRKSARLQKDTPNSACLSLEFLKER